MQNVDHLVIVVEIRHFIIRASHLTPRSQTEHAHVFTDIRIETLGNTNKNINMYYFRKYRIDITDSVQQLHMHTI